MAKDLTTMDEIATSDGEIAEPVSDIYIHKLSKPFEWEGVTYDKLTFDFESLTGKDMSAIEREMADINEFALSPEFSSSYMMRLAARAAKVNISVIENLPIREANAIRSKARAFLRKEGY